jgi:hypothetical protein
MNQSSELRPEPPTSPSRPAPASRARKDVANDILNAFHFACDIKDLEIAKRLLAALETLVEDRTATPGFDKPHALATIVAAYERLWALRHN